MSKRPTENDSIEPDEKHARLEVSETEVSETVVTGTEVSETEVPETVVTGTEVSETEVPETEVPETVVTETEVAESEVTESEVTLESSVTDNIEVVTEETKDGVDVGQVEEVAEDSTVITDENGIQYTVAKMEPDDEKLGVVEDGAVESVEEPVVEYEGQEVPEGSSVMTDEDGLQYTITEIETGDDKMGGGDGPVETVIDAGFAQNIIVQHMDIPEPLQTLRKLLENRLQCSLADHDFFLQDSLQLDPDRNLVEQCVQGEGMVQINVEVTSHPGSKPKINIVDILKPAEEIVEVPSEPEPAPATKIVIPEETEHITRWIVDQNFRKEQERLKIPFDPSLWNESHVKHWIQWATKEFSLVGVNSENFTFPGKRLCEMQYPEFSKLIPCDRGDVFWTHLELLRKCKFVATIQPSTPVPITTVTVSTSGYQAGKIRTPRILGQHGTPGNRTGNNGQIQLWQFLLDLLTDRDCREIISWCGDNGEFKLNNPEMVARLWGQRKNKPTMNYEKLSRALRYYYDGDMISKVHGKRFVYKYVCDLRCLLGYSAAELNQLVTECADKKLQKVRETLRPGIIRKVPVEKSPQTTTYMMVEKVVTPEVSRTEVVNSVTNIQIATSTDEISTS